MIVSRGLEKRHAPARRRTEVFQLRAAQVEIDYLSGMLGEFFLINWCRSD
jgi:hypothetical protein